MTMVSLAERGLLLVIAILHTSDALVRTAPFPTLISACYNSYATTSLRSVVGHQFCHFCEDRCLKMEKHQMKRGEASSRRYIERLMNKLDARAGDAAASGTGTGTVRTKRQTQRRRCRRREYRTLSDRERRRFHDAINTLKRDTSVFPNRYDAIANLHGDVASNAAHGGPNFLGFHRVLLLILEFALQEINPRICLPYWDSSLDNNLVVPEESQVFGPSFMGGRGWGGEVTDGPFARWRTPRHGPLIRNIGATGQLFTVRDISNILSQRRTIDIVPPFAALDNSLEFQHDGVHTFIGGQMIAIDSAAYDPLFFLHHCFVDYIWEIFRMQQRSSNINPDDDYPESVGSRLHSPDADLGFNLNINASLGFSSIWTSYYSYEVSPRCSRDETRCRSRHLRCNINRGRCIPIDRRFRRKRSLPAKRTSTVEQPLDGPVHPTYPVPAPRCKDGIKPIQNTFCIDGKCDIKQWVFVAVKVVTLRPPDLKNYPSYPIVNGHLSKQSDIYEPLVYDGPGRLSSPIPQEPKTYDKCKNDKGAGQIFVQTQGINYEGFYKESALIDQRLATSMSVTYVAVKKPTGGPVTALFRAFDACGRICQPSCKVPGSSTDQYKVCSGALEIVDVPGQPSQYSYDYGQASANIWHFDQNNDCPSLKNNDIPITFYCNYKDDLPITWIKQRNRESYNVTHHGPIPNYP